MVRAVLPRSPEPLMVVSGINKDYARGRLWSRAGTTVHALTGVDLTVRRGTTLAIVGQSGAGKSTLARCIAGLERPDRGEISFCGRPIPQFPNSQAQWFYREVQLVLQESATALNARFTAEQIITEPLVIQRIGDAGERHRRALSLLRDMGLSPDLAARRPRQLSGGQRQRLAIARALAIEPSLLIFDEAFSGLDLRVQKQIATLLAEVQRRRALTLIFISHDMALMAEIANEIAIMHRGRIVERGATGKVLGAPAHAHTRALIASIPGAQGAGASCGVGC